jgi:hypothetical protein
MWVGMSGRRRKRSARLPKQLALGLLEDAMGRVEQQQERPAQQQEHPAQQQEPGQQKGPAQREADERARAVPYPGAAVPSQAALPARSGLEPTGVPVDTSAGPAADDVMSSAPRPRCAERTGKSTRHGSLG